jgi:hypothetical protein
VPSRSGAATGPSPAPTKAAGGQLALYTLIATAKLNDVDRRPGSPMSWHTCRITPQNGSATCCRGTGTQNTVPPLDPLFGIENGVAFSNHPVPLSIPFAYLCIGMNCISTHAGLSSLLSTVSL